MSLLLLSLGTCEGVKVDIPKGFEDASKYNGTLAHKTQHDFNPNGEMRRVNPLLFFQTLWPPTIDHQLLRQNFVK